MLHEAEHLAMQKVPTNKCRMNEMARPPQARLLTFEFTERRHIPLAALRRSYTNLLGAWKGAGRKPSSNKNPPYRCQKRRLPDRLVAVMRRIRWCLSLNFKPCSSPVTRQCAIARRRGRTHRPRLNPSFPALALAGLSRHSEKQYPMRSNAPTKRPGHLQAYA